MHNNTYHHIGLKEQLIEAGILLLHGKGMEGVSLRAIAKQCQVSHAAPYRHFKDKEELLSEMQKHVEKQFTISLSESLKEENSDMITFGVAYVRFFKEHPPYYTLFMNQKNIGIKISKESGLQGEYQPFQLFLRVGQFHLESLNIPKEKWLVLLMQAWAIVHGLAGMAVMPSIEYDGHWEALVEQILKGETYSEK
ncbi:MAG: TetR/AcrR family transcriptional regulator [Coprobacillaceae bacterium]